MSATDPAIAPSPSETPVPVRAPVVAAPWILRSLRSLLERVGPRHAALAGILALSAVLNTHRLAQNGYANTFYSAGVRSMLRSWHNFLFVSFDPGGLVTIDKPPLGVWVQAASAQLFGFSPLSLLLPEAIISTLAVAALYRVLAPRLGAPAGLVGALALAVFPSFVAVSRDNGVDPLLILLMILACGAALRAIEGGRLRSLLWCAVLVGLAFNTKTLAAYLILPGIALAYGICAPGSWLKRAWMLSIAIVAIGIVSFSWIAFIELTPTSQRPFVGSSTDNTELGLTFAYNGFGRVEGEAGGPGHIPVAEGARVPRVPPRGPTRAHAGTVSVRQAARERARLRELAREHTARLAAIARAHSAVLPNGRLRNPISFGGPPGPWRLFEARLADQGSWMLPFALAGLLALGLAIAEGARTLRDARGDPRLAVLLVLGGWLLAEVVVLSFSKGILHPYYISALGPGVAAMTGAGALALARFARDRDWRALLLVGAVAVTVVTQVAILDDQRYMRWFAPLLAAGALACLAAMAVRRLAPAGTALLVCLLLAAPAAYASTTWLAPVEGTFPVAGPRQAAGDGNVGVSAAATRIDLRLIAYVRAHKPGTRWAVLTVAAPTAAPVMLLGLPAGALAGYSGTDPALDGAGLAHLVASGQARYIVLGGAYASRGGNLATKAVLRACPAVLPQAWHGPTPSPYSLALFDCAGRERALSGGAHVG